MNVKYLLTTLIIFCFFTINAQNFSKEFGKVGRDEIELTQYGKDKLAEAVVLFDIGMSSFYQNEGAFEINFERKTRIKILSEAGLKWAEIEIPFYQEGGIYEKISNIEAYTYNFEEGLLQKTKFDPTNCHEERLNEYWLVKKFVLPNVKVGSIIEFKYQLTSQYVFNLRDWEFQWKIPLVYSEYVVKMIPFYEYTYLLQGTNKFDEQISYIEKGLPQRYGSITYQEMVHKYIMKNLSAFNDEEFISSVNDYIIKIDFQLSKINYPQGGIKNILTTWPDLIRDLTKHDEFGKYLLKSEKLAPKIIDINALKEKESQEIFDYIIDHVKSNYNWNKINSKYSSKSPSDFLKDKFGNCADINLFAIGLLRAAGIESYPVIISTRTNGKIKYDYPYSHFFNYVLILVNLEGSQFLTDATEVLASNQRIPARCINDKGLIIRKDNPEWINLQFNLLSEIQKNIFINLKNDDGYADIKITANEYDGLYLRNVYGNDSKKIKELYAKDGYDIIDSTILIGNFLNNEEPYLLNFAVNYKNEIINGKYYVLPFLNELIDKNPLTQEKRTYPIDIVYPQKKSFNTIIEIPDGYIVEHMPNPQRISNDLFDMVYEISQEGNQIKVLFYYSFKKTVYPSSDYSSIKFYFNEIIRKGNEKIVISKSVNNKNI